METPPPDPFFVESLVAAIGIQPLVSHTFRQVADYQLERAHKLPEEIDRKLTRFVNRTEPEECADLPDWDFDEVKGWLTGDEKPEDVQKTIAAFADPQLGFEVSRVVARIRDHLAASIPRRQHASLTGVVDEPPPHVDLARFHRLWRVACDPVGILNDLNEYALSFDQVAGCETMFPLVWKRMDEGIDSVLTEKKTTSPKFTLLRQKEQLLRKLGKRPSLTSDQLSRDMQAVYAAESAAAQAPPKKKPSAGAAAGADVEATPAQQIR
jgi:hypothetical protein